MLKCSRLNAFRIDDIIVRNKDRPNVKVLAFECFSNHYHICLKANLNGESFVEQ